MSIRHRPWCGGLAATAAVLALVALPRPASAEAGPDVGEWIVSPAAELEGSVPASTASRSLCTLRSAAGPRSRAGRSSARAPADPGPPEYYGFPLVTTSRLPGTARADGVGRVVFPSTSPFGVALAEDGSYRYDLVLSTDGLPRPRTGRYVVWVTTPSLDQVRRVGPLPEDGRLRGRVDWNKFLVVLTLEPEESAPVAATGSGGGGPSTGRPTAASVPPQEMWSGPIVMRGMSRSGMMHTMAGHGPFEEENCAAYGY